MLGHYDGVITVWPWRMRDRSVEDLWKWLGQPRVVSEYLALAHNTRFGVVPVLLVRKTLLVSSRQLSLITPSHFSQ